MLQEAFTNPYGLPADRLRQLRDIETQNDALIAAVTRYGQNVSSYDRVRYTAFVVTYAEADHVKQEADNMTSQSLEVLQGYAAVITFLRAANETQAALERHIREINAVHDFNALAGMHESIYARAWHIREARRMLESETAPEEYVALQAVLLARCDAMATGIDLLAYGMHTAIDSHIYGATAVIEQVTNEYDTKGTVLMYESNQASPTLKSVAEISEKLDILDDGPNR